MLVEGEHFGHVASLPRDVCGLKAVFDLHGLHVASKVVALLRTGRNGEGNDLDPGLGHAEVTRQCRAQVGGGDAEIIGRRRHHVCELSKIEMKLTLLE